MKMKVHDKKISTLTDIDKFILIPKKMWDEFEIGDIYLNINNKKVQTRVYDILCDCVKDMHHHRILDLRSVWDDLELKDGMEVEILK